MVLWSPLKMVANHGIALKDGALWADLKTLSGCHDAQLLQLLARVHGCPARCSDLTVLCSASASRVAAAEVAAVGFLLTPFRLQSGSVQATCQEQPKPGALPERRLKMPAPYARIPKWGSLGVVQ